MLLFWQSWFCLDQLSWREPTLWLAVLYEVLVLVMPWFSKTFSGESDYWKLLMLFHAGWGSIYWQYSIYLCLGSSGLFVHGAIRIFHSEVDYSWRFWDCTIDSCRPGGIFLVQYQYLVFRCYLSYFHQNGILIVFWSRVDTSSYVAMSWLVEGVGISQHWFRNEVSQ